MAGVDASIYLNQQVPDIMGNIARGLAMRDQMDQRSQRKSELDRLAKERDDRAAVQNAFQAGIVQNPDGSTSYDNALVQSRLGQLAGNPYAGQELYNLSQTMQAKQAADQKLKMDQDLHKAQILKLGAETRQLNMKPTDRISKLTEAEKTVDRTFGKDYADWTAGGSDIARSEIKKLKDVSNSLNPKEGGTLTTGGLTGMFPDRMTSNDVLKARADVQSTVMNSLRAILGAQFTEKEGERIIKNTWNESDSTENNLARIDRLVADLENKANAKDAQSRYYEGNRTLSGYQPVTNSELTQSPKDPTGKKPPWAL